MVRFGKSLASKLMFLLCGALLCPQFVLADCQNGNGILERPSPSFLDKAIREGNSYISEDARNQVATVLSQLDRRLLSFLPAASVSALPHQQNHWIEKQTQRWKWAPSSERAILATLTLQIDMLQLRLYQVDPAAADQFFKDRHAVRVRKKTDSYFGDARDRYIAELLQCLIQIEAAQKLLGSQEELDIRFPSDVENFSAIETYLISRLEKALRGAQTLL